MLFRQQRVDGERIAGAHGVFDRRHIAEQVTVFSERQRLRGNRLGFAALHRPALGLPGVQTAVENRRVIEAIVAQHPPQPRRPVRDVSVEHQARIVADAQLAQRRRERIRIRQRKAQRARGVA